PESTPTATATVEPSPTDEPATETPTPRPTDQITPTPEATATPGETLGAKSATQTQEVTCAADPANVLPNPSFEMGDTFPDGWYSPQPSDLGLDADGDGIDNSGYAWLPVEWEGSIAACGSRSVKFASSCDFTRPDITPKYGRAPISTGI